MHNRTNGQCPKKSHPSNTIHQKQCNKNEQLISKLNMADGRIFELKGVSVETSKTEKQRE